MNRVSYSGKYYPALAEVISPAADRLSSVAVVLQPIDILRFEDDMLAILVVFYVMLLIINDEITNALGDGVFALRWSYAKGA